MRVRLGLQARLVILVMAAILPITGLSIWLSVRQMEQSTELAQSQLRLAASLVAANQDNAVDSAQQLLAAISAMPELRSGSRARCQRYFESIKNLQPAYSNIGLLAVDGSMICHANGSMGDFGAADRSYFREALNGRRFVMGEAIVGRASRRWTIPFALPVIEEDVVTGVVFAALDLEHAALALARADLPPGARVAVADRHGRVLMEHPPQPGRPTPRKLTHVEFADAARTMSAGWGEGPDVFGTMRLYAFAPSGLVGEEGFMVRVGLDRSLVTAGARGHLRDALSVLLLTLLAGAAGAWWLGRRFIVSPARSIVDTVRQLEAGRLDARVSLPGAPREQGEFGRIAGAFNLMAESLQLRQKDLEAELGRSQGAYALLDRVVNSMQEGLIAVSATGELLLSNEAASRLLPVGGAWPQPQHRAQWFGLHQADGSRLLQSHELPISRALSGETGQQQVLMRNPQVPDGRLLQCSFQPLQAAGGPAGALLMFTDVTEQQRDIAARKESEQALLDSRQELEAFTRMLQRAAEASHRIAQARTPEKTLQLVVEQARDVLGARAATIRLDPEVAAVAASSGEPLPPDGGPGTLTVPLATPTGERIGVLQLAAGAGGTLTEGEEYVALELAQVAAIAIENARLFAQVWELNTGLEARIAERTAQLAQQQARYRALAEQAPEVVWNVDAEGNATFLSKAWYDLVGGQPEDWLGQGWIRRIHRDDMPSVVQNWERSRETLKPYSGTRRVRARDGRWRTMSYRATPVLDETGRPTSWVGIDSDVTDLKTVEEALRTSNRELEAFSYSVSHDLRAPLSAIGGFSQALAQRLEGQLDERSRHYVARVLAGVDRMAQLIDALLSLSNVVRTPLVHTSVDLSAIARETLDGLRMAAPGRQVEAVVQDGLKASGDARLVRVLFDNLLGNAWKFTTHQAAARIEVGMAPDGEFFVRDNGVGFDMAHAGKLFGPFQRLHSEAEFPGTGIGLATVQRIVARHQGRIRAESRPGEGATFWFTLGAVQVPARKAAADQAA